MIETMLFLLTMRRLRGCAFAEADVVCCAPLLPLLLEQLQ